MWLHVASSSSDPGQLRPGPRGPQEALHGTAGGGRPLAVGAAGRPAGRGRRHRGRQHQASGRLPEPHRARRGAGRRAAKRGWATNIQTQSINLSHDKIKRAHSFP